MVEFVRPSHLPRFGDPAPAQPARDARIETTPVPANVGYLFALGHSEYFELGGIPLRVPPVPAIEGAQLYELRTRIDNARAAEQASGLTPEQFRNHAQVIVQLQRMLTRLLRPVRKRDKLRRLLGLWRPLRHATESELGGLLHFLLALRAKSNIRLRSANAAQN